MISYVLINKCLFLLQLP